jgi:hypothetical protein
MEENTMHVFTPKMTSLYSVIHENSNVAKQLTDFEKVTIAIEIAKAFE